MRKSGSLIVRPAFALLSWANFLRRETSFNRCASTFSTGPNSGLNILFPSPASCKCTRVFTCAPKVFFSSWLLESARLVPTHRHHNINTQRRCELSIKAKAAPAKVKKKANADLRLDDLVDALPGVGLKKAKLFAALSISTIRDLLGYYPRSYNIPGRHTALADAAVGENITAVGTVEQTRCVIIPRRKLVIVEVIIDDGTARVKAMRFWGGGSPHATAKLATSLFAQGRRVAASGVVQLERKRTASAAPQLTMDRAELTVLDGGDDSSCPPIQPIYRLTADTTSSSPVSSTRFMNVIRLAVTNALPTCSQLEDPLPEEVREMVGLEPLSDAIRSIHFPKDEDAKVRARRRIVFDELLALQLALVCRRASHQQCTSPSVLFESGDLLPSFLSHLPFKLTGAQERVMREVLDDMEGKHGSMNRLLVGDVGSGKTVIAAAALLAAVQSGGQGVLLAPTEVLAFQHVRLLERWLHHLPVRVRLFTGSIKGRERDRLVDEVASGSVHIVVGTHALLYDTLKFRRLGLAVVDEQHRFGVEQRAQLQNLSPADNDAALAEALTPMPHMLTMSATPIPRTLALTIHGDLDLSYLDEVPPGRRDVHTEVLTDKQRQRAYQLIRDEVDKGRQAFVLLPLVDDKEWNVDLRSAVKEHERLRRDVFPDLQVGLLHGQMPWIEKQDAIQKFSVGATQVLVCTTVVEVGVDVPNASVMVIDSAERFGLAQLHQLRGRVGRSSHQSYCILISGSNSPDSLRRLQVVQQSHDGFFIARKDLDFRGAGEMIGTKQSGVADFNLANVIEDEQLLFQAREVAEALLNQCGNNLMVLQGKYPALLAHVNTKFKGLTVGLFS